MPTARRLVHQVPGSPLQPDDQVLVVAAVDTEVFDVSYMIGKRGVVEHLEYSCGCGQSYPEDPMIGVRFADGSLHEFWREELSVAPGPGVVDAGDRAIPPCSAS